MSAIGPAGPAGLTASSVSSLSLDPPPMVVGIASGSRTLAAARAAGRFAISVLAAAQDAVALQFASPRPGRDKYDRVAHRLGRGAPTIAGAAAWVACDLHASHPAGDHQLIVGQVCAMGGHADSPTPPLIAHGGRLTTIAPTPESQPPC